MDEPSKLPWLWVIEALAGFREFPLSALQGLIDAAPVSHPDFPEHTKELIALRCLEELSSNAASSSSRFDSSTLPLDSSRTSLDVIQLILSQVPLLNPKTAESALLKWDVNPFIKHKRTDNPKCHLEKLKESILDGTLSLTDSLKERSGLLQTNREHTVYPTNLCQSSGQHKDIHGESDIPFNATLVPQHTYGGETNDIVHVEPIPINDGNTNNIQHMTNQPQPQQKQPNAATLNVLQKPVASDKAVVDNQSQPQQKQPSAATLNVLQKPVASNDKAVVDNQSQPQQKQPSAATLNMLQKPVASSDKAVVDNQSQPQQKQPNAATLNVSQKPVASDKAVVDTVSGAELSSDSDTYPTKQNDLAAKKDEFLRSQHAFRQDLPAKTGPNLCIKCHEGGQLLVCKITTCSLMVHKNCLGDSAQLDANENFLCPFCAYSHNNSEYHRAKKICSLERKQLAIFSSKGIRNMHEVL